MNTVKPSVILTFAILLYGCSTATRLNNAARMSSVGASSMSTDVTDINTAFRTDESSAVMNTIKDDSGKDIPFDILSPATVTARHKQIAERNGRINLEFDITVPKGIISDMYQLRIVPVAITAKDSNRLDSLLFTGLGFRERQQNSYSRFDRYMERVAFLNDRERLLYKRSLGIFLERNTIMELGVSEEEAVEHYTRKWLRRYAHKKKAGISEYYSKCITEPYIRKGIMLDSTITNPEKEIRYFYRTSIPSRPGIKYIDIVTESSIHSDGMMAPVNNNGDTIRFYISSLSSLADMRTRYLRKISVRDSVISTNANFIFCLGDHRINDSLYENLKEKERISKLIDGIFNDCHIVTDSIVITGGASPEGKKDYNIRLSQKRAGSISEMINSIITKNRIRRSQVYICPFGNNTSEKHTAYTTSSLTPEVSEFQHMSVRSYGRGTDWEMLKKEIIKAQYISLDEKERILGLIAEENYKAIPDRGVISDSIYPIMRNARIDIYLHKKDAINDTIVTNIVDTVYMKGLECLADRDYSKALEQLRPYNDYNTALAYLLMDYNHTCISILENIRSSPERDYLLGIAYTRTGNKPKAMELLVKAIASSERIRLRAKLDPECGILK